MRGAMAMDRSAAMDIPGARSSLTPEKDNATENPAAKKKKGFQPLKSLKKLFGGKKKGKKEEGVTGVGIKSTSYDALETHREGPSSPLAKNLSMSEDSIFSSDKPLNPDLDITRSMDVIPRRNFKDELAHKLHSRRGDDDDGLPSSPPSHTTTMDALIENGLKDTSMSMNSEHSLMSMDSEAELEEEFFAKGWTAGISKSPNTSDLGEGLMDLDVVSSTRSLNMTAAKHKIAIRPQAKRISALPGQRRKNAASPKPAVVLPQLREESPPKSVQPEGQSSKDPAESTDEELEAAVIPSPAAAVTKVTKEPAPKEESQHATAADHQDDSKDDAKDEQDIIIQPEESVVRSKETLKSVSSEEHQTVTSTKSEVTVFGERKTNRSSLILENRNWDEVGKPKDKSPDEEPEKKGSEFASVFAKFKRNSSQRKDGDEEADKVDSKRGSGSSVHKPQKPDKEAPVQTTTASVTASQTKASVTQGVAKTANKAATGSDVTGRLAVVSQDVPGAKSTSHSIPAKATKTPAKAQSKPATVILRANPADTDKTNSLEKDKRNSDEKVKRDSVEKVTKLSTEKVKRNSTEKEKVKRDSTEEKKRDSVEKGKRNSSEKDVSLSEEKAKRTSAEGGKRDSTEKKRSSAEVGNTESPQTNTEHKDKEDKTLVIQKTSNKFVSVQQKSVPLNDKKSEATPSHSRDPSSKPAPTDAAKSQTTKTVQIVSKEQVPDTSKDGSLNAPSEEANTKKRDSPRPTNRLRSQTLPEQPVSKDLPSSTDYKRANSQETGVNKENIPAKSEPATSPDTSSPATPASDASPQKSTAILRSTGSGRPDPQKIAKATPKEGGGGQPSWINLARKRTEGWNEEKEKVELRNKREMTEEEKSAKRASVLDLMKRFQ